MAETGINARLEEGPVSKKDAEEARPECPKGKGAFLKGVMKALAQHEPVVVTVIEGGTPRVIEEIRTRDDGVIEIMLDDRSA